MKYAFLLQTIVPNDRVHSVQTVPTLSTTINGKCRHRIIHLSNIIAAPVRLDSLANDVKSKSNCVHRAAVHAHMVSVLIDYSSTIVYAKRAGRVHYAM
jgi:hypothetical protein